MRYWLKNQTSFPFPKASHTAWSYPNLNGQFTIASSSCWSLLLPETLSGCSGHLRSFLFPQQDQQTLSQSPFQVMRGTVVTVLMSCFNYSLALSPYIFIFGDIPICSHSLFIFHLILILVRDTFILCWAMAGNCGSFFGIQGPHGALVSQLLGEDKMIPTLLLFPIFREVHPLRYSPPMLKVAGRTGNQLGVVALPLSMNDKQICTPSRPIEAVILATGDRFWIHHTWI